MGRDSAHPSINPTALAVFSRDLRRVDGYDELIALVRAEVSDRFGLTNAWLYVCEGEADPDLVLVASSGPKSQAIREIVPVIPRKGDALVEALLREEGVVVIPDAQAGPYPEVTRQLQNRTVINMPMNVLDHALGILGCGTFGDEGVVPIDTAATDYLAQMANSVSVVLARLVLRKRDAERAELQAQLAHRQRLESLGLLAGGVAHDFNNLLTIIRMSATLLADAPLTVSQRTDLNQILEAERSASQLTQSLLMLGQKQALAMRSVDINVVIERFVSMVRRLVPADINIDFVAASALPKLQLDQSQLEQVLMNLALNARDAMPHGGRLTFETQQVVIDSEYRRAHPWAKSGRYVLLTVHDTGAGMSPEVLERVFEPFFTTKRAGEGTGLGLAVTWSIVQQHGGMIQCYSELGLGTAFKVYLPGAEQLASQVETKLSAAAPGGSERVLVADDQPLVLNLLKRVLEGAGYVVTTAADGAEAVALAASSEFELYLLDAVMPRLNGREACERIRQRQPRARFLFASGYGSDALPASFLKDLGIEMVQKPLHPDDLLRAVRRVLDAT